MNEVDTRQPVGIEHPPLDARTATLFDGCDTSIAYEDGRTEAIRVAQFKLVQYEAAFLRVDNEFNLVSLACGQKDGWAQTLTPGSYEVLLLKVQEVNANGFFAYAARRQALLVQRLNSLSPETLKAASEAAAISSTLSPRLRPRQV